MTPAAVGLGGNLDRPDLAFRVALEHLGADRGLALRAVSRVWRSAAWGVEDQPDFLNAVAVFETRLQPLEMLALLRRRETAAGRRGGRRWGPRPLDLDLLTWGDVALEGPCLVVPHPRMAERSFVLEPMAEVLPDWTHPITGRTCAQMLETLRASGQATPCRVVPAMTLEPPRDARCLQ